VRSTSRTSAAGDALDQFAEDKPVAEDVVGGKPGQVARMDVPARWRAPSGASSWRQAHHERGCGLPEDQSGGCRTCRIVMVSLPCCPNSGQYRATASSRANSPPSANWCTSNATKGFAGRKDPEQRIRPGNPMHYPRTTSPCRSTHNCATAPRALTKSNAMGQCRCIDTNIFWWRLHPIDHT